MTATEYTVRINSKDGALEVIGPDKEWVDAKVEQLSDVFVAYRAESETPIDENGAGAQTTARRASKSKRAKKTPGTSEAPPKRKSRGRVGVSDELAALLTPEVTKKLDAYYEARSKAFDGGLSAQAAIIATFLKDELSWPGVDPHDLYTVYTTMGWKLPGNPQSQLVNARQRARFFSTVSNGKSILSMKGENFARHDSLNGSDDES